ncbi:MAG: TetR/AcrR family transcriptional regulator [Promethearchaeota archaeon]
MKEKLSKKDQIINAALKIITKKGNMNFTIREVIMDAEVNIASVNYYFGTKKKLIQEIEKKFLQSFIDFQILLKNTKIPPKQRLFEWSSALIEHLINNPGIVLILSNKLILTEQFDEDFEILNQENNHWLSEIVKEITGIKEEEQIQLRVVRFNAALYFPMLFVTNSEKMFGFSIQDDGIRKKYVQSIIDSIL